MNPASINERVNCLTHSDTQTHQDMTTSQVSPAKVPVTAWRELEAFIQQSD